MFQIDAMSRTPVYEQVITQVEKFVLAGILTAGDKMPSVRNLSMELSVNPNTIQKAYTELDRRGITCSVPGKGNFISENALEILREDRKNHLEDLSNVVGELKLAGIPYEDVRDCVVKIYGEEKK
ncbi:MAG: GntR family transcriptional regulator [Lachnospiraceae bacterium]|nr:GntR family transcriptional regulator [Lachnospiraceae bacterium]